MQLPYFYEPLVTGVNTILLLGDDTSRHCVQVLRMREGERLQLTNGEGNIYTAVIVSANKKQCGVRIEETQFEPRPERKISIAISLLKNANRFEWFLEKAVEIGVQEIVPLLCSRTEKQHFKQERMQQIVTSAMLQSRQVWLPLLHQPTAYETALTQSKNINQKLIAHCLENETRRELGSIPIQNNTQILIGPEGDFTPAEIELALNHGYTPVSLGNTRLRTETAGVVASALLLHYAKTGS